MAREKKRPETSSPTPHTQSWFLSTWSDRADGTPSRKAPTPTKRTAFLRSTPPSTSTRVASSTIAIRLVMAARPSAVKKSSMITLPKGNVPIS